MKPGYAMAGVFLALFLAALNQTMVSTAMPSIVASLGGIHLYAWVFSAFMLASTIFVPIYGKLSDHFGRRPIFLFGLLLFMTGSLLAGFAADMPQLIAVRALQGLGAGAIFPIAFAIVGDLYAPAERGRVQGLIGGAFGVASLLGPLAGGWITEHVSWRWAFWANVPVGLLAVGVALATLPHQQRPHGPVSIDYLGAATLVGAIAPLMLLAGLGGQTIPWLSPQAAGLALVGLASGVGFVFAERRALDPVIPLSLFRNPIFSVSALASLLVGVIMFGQTMFIPLFAQGVLGGTATAAGLVLTPLMLSTVVGSTLAGQLSSRTGRYRGLGVAGVATALVGALLLATMSPATPYAELVRNVAVAGVGIGMTFPIFLLAVQNAVPQGQMGVVTSLVQFSRSIGGTVGVAVLGAVMTYHTAAEIREKTGGTGPVPDVQGLMSPAGRAALDPAVLQTVRDALAHALHEVFVYGACVAALAFLVTLLLKEIPLRARHQPAVDAAGQELAAEPPAVAAVVRPEDEPRLVDE